VGLVMVYSASIAMPDNPKFAKYTHTYFLVRHAMWLVMAFVAALLAYQVPMDRWEKWAPWLFIALPGTAHRGADSGAGQGGLRCAALDIAGALSFQPSELAKFAVLLYAADYMVRKMEVKERFFRAVMHPWVRLWPWWVCCCWLSPTWARSW
jgi:cell division protein FtsW